jgi:15-cis-phytoene synthase
MQLSNIARDVGEDAAEKRLFLPLEWLRDEGIDPDTWLDTPLFTPALGRVVQRLLSAADTLYERVGQGIAELPAACRPGIGAARTLYQEIGRQVERNGLDSVTQRAVVSGRRKAALLSRGLVLPLDRSGSANPAPLDEAAFLIRAVVDADAASTAIASALANRNQPTRVESSNAAPALPWWNIQDRALWLVDLFERLERKDQERASS